MGHRTCSKCGLNKPETAEYFRRRGRSDRGGLRPDCRDCSAERDREYHLRNREARLARNAQYRAENQDKIRAKDRAYAQTAGGKAVRYRAVVNYLQTDGGRDVHVTSRQKRRAAKAGTGADFTRADWRACLAAFEHRCAYCGTGGQMTRDHVVPLDKGGLHTASNVVPACRSCNCRKFTTSAEMWFPAQDFFDQERLDRIREYQRRTAEESAA